MNPISANRAAAALTPVSMGLVASATGLATSFFIVGGVLLGALAIISAYLARRPDIVRE